MKNNLTVSLIVLMGLSFIPVSCEKNPTDGQPGDPVSITTEAYQKEVIDSANKFAFDIFRPVLADAAETENVMISPFSISSALSMVLNGAAGETSNAISKTLRMDGKTIDEINGTYLKLMTDMVPVDERVTMEIANSVWVEKRLTVKQPFITALQTSYKAESRSIDVTDPNAVKTVNDWITDKTHDRITDMLDNLDPDLAMLLINAIYFNGKWRNQFDKDDTNEQPFYVTVSSPKTVSMMHQKNNMKAARTGNATIVEIPYGQGNYTMVVVLPDENVTPGEIAGTLTPAVWQGWMGQLSTCEVELSMPRFKYKYRRVLNDDLTGLGMGVAFSDFADFSNISDQSLAISRVIHQTFIENDEEGTEAAAATVVEMKFTSTGPDLMAVNINHPFLYFIRESSTGTIVFMGKVGDPTVN